jgi:hypothetical protein
MRPVRFRHLALLCAAAFLAACGKATVRPGVPDPAFSLESLRSGSSGLVVSGDVRVTEFKKSFKAVFGTGDSLAAYLSARILDSLNRGLPRIEAYALPPSLFPFPGDTAAAAPPAAPVPRPAVPTHVLRIRNLAVEKSTRELPVMLLPSDPQNMMQAGGGKSEGCTVSFDVEIWETAGPGLLAPRYTFSVTGRADVPLYAYKSALKEAVNAAARGTARHLRGK